MAEQTDKQPHLVDRHVGLQLRQLRRARGLSQNVLGEALGLTFQQVQKYEKGANRISASKLYDTAVFLGVDVGRFFEGLGRPTADGVAEEPAVFEVAPPLSREVTQAAQLLERQPLAVRKRMLELLKALAPEGD